MDKLIKNINQIMVAVNKADQLSYNAILKLALILGIITAFLWGMTIILQGHGIQFI